MSLPRSSRDCPIRESEVRRADIYEEDNLLVMEKLPRHSIDLICTNPPFFIASQGPTPTRRSTSHHHVDQTWRTMTVPKDWPRTIEAKFPQLLNILSALREVHSNSLYNYLMYLSIRLIQMKHLLKETGSIFLHCGPEFSHSVKLCMDSIFGWKQFRNEVVFCFYGRGTNERQKSFQKKHEIVLFYSQSDRYKFHKSKASRFVSSESLDTDNSPIPLDIFADFKISPKTMILEDWWRIPPPRGHERTSYPNQKPESLYRRIIEVTTDEGDLVLDPFFGSGTVCVESARLQRQWIGIDVNQEASKTLQDRLNRELGMGRLSEAMTGTRGYHLAGVCS